ncbi:MAG: PepSY domain-containing protein [Pseudomonadota bacterium]|nr:PepSY domain-containing protein [Pseudomonadota bacterium]
MAKTGRTRLRAGWLQVHKWIGLTLAVLIIPICLTGSALVWHDWLDAKLEPQRHAIIGPAALTPGVYVEAARSVLASDERVSTIRFNADGRPVQIVATTPLSPGASGRPPRINIWLDPVDARVIDNAPSSSGMVQVMHVLHGSLMVPGWGRTIVGWVGVVMLVSSISGLWLWWPLSGSFSRGLRWRRRNSTNANLHYQMGFWILIPLAMLSFTGAWISFPKVFGQFEPGGGQSSAGASRQRTAPALPLLTTVTSVDRAAVAAAPHATGPLTAIAWPTDQKPEWKVSFEREGSPAEVAVSDRDGTATPPAPPKPETLARTMRRWHDGTGLGLGWQIVIFFGGIIPAALSVTGVIIWWRSRKPRARAEAYRRRGLSAATGSLGGE